MVSAAMTLTFGFPQMIHSMEPEKKNIETTQISQGQKLIILTPTEQKTINKMVMFFQYPKEGEENGLPLLPKEIHGVIFEILHELTKNLVLEGELIYTRPSDKKPFPIKIKDNLKEGTFDLSNKEIFGDVANDLLITTDPTKFFLKHMNKVVILIAPRFLIEEQLNDTAAPFKSIFAAWKKGNEIGLFWRSGNWKNYYFDYLINQTPTTLSQNNLYELWKNTPVTHHLTHISGITFTRRFHVSFLNQVRHSAKEGSSF